MKIQILELPTEYVGEYSKTPYALIASEVEPSHVEAWGKALQALRDNDKGPAWTMATDEEVEL